LCSSVICMPALASPQQSRARQHGTRHVDHAREPGFVAGSRAGSVCLYLGFLGANCVVSSRCVAAAALCLGLCWSLLPDWCHFCTSLSLSVRVLSGGEDVSAAGAPDASSLVHVGVPQGRTCCTALLLSQRILQVCSACDPASFGLVCIADGVVATCTIPCTTCRQVNAQWSRGAQRSVQSTTLR